MSALASPARRILTQSLSQLSTLLANCVLLRAYYERPNFYSAAVYISQSNGSLMVRRLSLGLWARRLLLQLLANLAFIILVACGYGLQLLFYGRLRAIEIEQLYDNAWFALSETLLAMTIFRDDVGLRFFAMFLLLLGAKMWLWIGQGRVEFLEQQPPANPRLFHTRLSLSLLVSIAFDLQMVKFCLYSFLSNPLPLEGKMVMFGSEYVLLVIASCSTILRYVLYFVEMTVIRLHVKERAAQRQRERQQSEQRPDRDANQHQDDDDTDADVPGWEEKGSWVFALDLVTGMAMQLRTVPRLTLQTFSSPSSTLGCSSPFSLCKASPSIC